ncbi:MAG: gamma-glutamyl-gamma-aminobutyrate hydrolase family protein [Pseudomonadota bacterium]
MKITIIETGKPPTPLNEAWASYPVMFEALIGAADPDFTYETVPLLDQRTLPAPDSLDAILITGSPAGVYDPEPWMAPLMAFIRSAAAARIPQFGICFGHQAIAEALGGKVEKSDKGWGLGRHTYTSPHRPDWLNGVPDPFSLAVSHQDQVVAIPEGASVIAASHFTPFAGLDYGDLRAASFQGHPEFSPAYTAALHQLRRDHIGGEIVDEAVASLRDPLDAPAIGAAMARFFRHTG